MDSIFQKHSVVIAHCLTNNGGAGNTFSTGKNIYQRIDDVIAHQLELSCSTIKTNDTLLGQNNFFGPVGIILRATNVTYANPGDGGTNVDRFGTRDYFLEASNEPTAANIENAILNRTLTGYNELCINHYSVFGLFLCFDDTQYLRANIQNELVFHQNTSKHNLPYFNLSNGTLYSSSFNPNANMFQVNGVFNTQDIYR